MRKKEELTFTRPIYINIKQQLILELKSKKIRIIFHPSTGIFKEITISPIANETKISMSKESAENLISTIILLICAEFNLPVNLPSPSSPDSAVKGQKIANQKENKITGFITKTMNAVVVPAEPLDQDSLNYIKERFLRIEQTTDLEMKEKILKYLNTYAHTKNSHKYCAVLRDQITCIDIIFENLHDFVYNKFTTDAVKKIIKKNNDVIQDLIEANLVNRRGTNLSESLNEEMKNENSSYKTKLRYSLKCIYEVRNKKVHSSIDLLLCKKAIRMLDNILRVFWQSNFKKLTQ